MWNRAPGVITCIARCIPQLPSAVTGHRWSNLSFSLSLSWSSPSQNLLVLRLLYYITLIPSARSLCTNISLSIQTPNNSHIIFVPYTWMFSVLRLTVYDIFLSSINLHILSVLLTIFLFKLLFCWNKFFLYYFCFLLLFFRHLLACLEQYQPYVWMAVHRIIRTAHGQHSIVYKQRSAGHIQNKNAEMHSIICSSSLVVFLFFFIFVIIKTSSSPTSLPPSSLSLWSALSLRWEGKE